MLGELAIRFVLGGAIVTAFAVVAEVFEPKTFAGMFGAAPSVALASLALAYAQHGGDYAATEARSMLVGALAFGLYAAACLAAVRRPRLPVWLGAAAAWAAWAAVALGGGFALLELGGTS
jgi:hypothetical protein